MCPKRGLAIVFLRILLADHRRDIVDRREKRELFLHEGRATVRRADDENRHRRGRMDSAARDLLVVGIEASPNAHLCWKRVRGFVRCRLLGATA